MKDCSKPPPRFLRTTAAGRSSRGRLRTSTPVVLCGLQEPRSGRFKVLQLRVGRQPSELVVGCIQPRPRCGELVGKEVVKRRLLVGHEGDLRVNCLCGPG